MTSTNNTQEPDVEEIETLIKDNLIAYCCRRCGGGGYDYGKEQGCSRCDGLGIVDFEVKHVAQALNQLILKAKIDEASRHSDTYYVNKDGRLKKEYKADRIAELNSKLKKEK